MHEAAAREPELSGYPGRQKIVRPPSTVPDVHDGAADESESEDQAHVDGRPEEDQGRPDGRPRRACQNPDRAVREASVSFPWDRPEEGTLPPSAPAAGARSGARWRGPRASTAGLEPRSKQDGRPSWQPCRRTAPGTSSDVERGRRSSAPDDGSLINGHSIMTFALPLGVSWKNERFHQCPVAAC